MDTKKSETEMINKPYRKYRRTKRTPEQKRQIYEEWLSGTTYAQLQSKHQISNSTISKIVTEFEDRA